MACSRPVIRLLVMQPHSGPFALVSNHRAEAWGFAVFPFFFFTCLLKLGGIGLVIRRGSATARLLFRFYRLLLARPQ